MAKGTTNQAASIKQRLLNLARKQGRIYEVVLVRYALERMLYRLSVSDQRDRFILKGGMLVTLWIDGGNRETLTFLGTAMPTRKSSELHLPKSWQSLPTMGLYSIPKA